ncbi:hypothetical protein Syun_015902 [Stephania yunnanensis]|uniref:ENTH domain-containing protein n=1 Tax=Stephania yunnanensis TaxID=152371 RepID=A0AAP0P3B9_9MAGN
MSSSMIGNMGSSSTTTPFFHEFKKQASFFFREKIKTARLALTDVTPVQLLTEEATNGNSWAPDPRTMRLISRAAFELDDYCRIVEILHKRLQRFDRKNWRGSYHAVVLLEHLLTHGPESVADEFQRDKDAIRDMESFQYIDERGFNWGLTVRKKSERVLALLEERPLLKEERNRARKLSRGIEGFGSFCNRSSAMDESLTGSSFEAFGRCNSQYSTCDEKNDMFSSEETNTTKETHEEDTQKPQIKGSLDENTAPGEVREWEAARESSKPLLSCKEDRLKTEHLIDEDHPFNNQEVQSSAALLTIN